MLLQLVASGVANGSLYALIALGMTVLFRTTNLINLAHGEFAMAAAYFTFAGVTVLEIPYAAAALGAFALLVLIGLAIERGLIRPLANAPHLAVTLMILAVASLARGVARYFFGRDVEPFPGVIEGEPVEIAGAVFLPQDLLLIVGAIATLVLFFLIFERSRFGKIMQAASQNPRGAALVGINVPRFQATMWGVTALLGAMAGVLVAPVTLLYPDMGVQILVKGLAAMTLGGFGSLTGAVLGGYLLGIGENLAGGYIASSLTEIAAFVLIVAVLLIRPRGLMGEWRPSRV